MRHPAHKKKVAVSMVAGGVLLVAGGLVLAAPWIAWIGALVLLLFAAWILYLFLMKINTIIFFARRSDESIRKLPDVDELRWELEQMRLEFTGRMVDVSNRMNECEANISATVHVLRGDMLQSMKHDSIDNRQWRSALASELNSIHSAAYSSLEGISGLVPLVCEKFDESASLRLLQHEELKGEIGRSIEHVLAAEAGHQASMQSLIDLHANGVSQSDRLERSVDAIAHAGNRLEGSLVSGVDAIRHEVRSIYSTHLSGRLEAIGLQGDKLADSVSMGIGEVQEAIRALGDVQASSMHVFEASAMQVKDDLLAVLSHKEDIDLFASKLLDSIVTREDHSEGSRRFVERLDALQLSGGKLANDISISVMELQQSIQALRERQEDFALAAEGRSGRLKSDLLAVLPQRNELESLNSGLLASLVSREDHSAHSTRLIERLDAIGLQAEAIAGGVTEGIKDVQIAMIGLKDAQDITMRGMESSAANIKEELLGGLKAGLEAVSEKSASETARLAQEQAEGNRIAERSATIIAETNRDIGKLGSQYSVELGRAVNALTRELDALMYLHDVVPALAIAPLLGDWAMDPEGMSAVVKLIMEKQPKLVVECGSGASTIWIGRALKQIGSGKLLSIEHLEKYRDQALGTIESEGLGSYVDVLSAPLREQKIKHEKYNWYDIPKSRIRKGSIQVLLVDGPPGDSGSLARYPALPLMLPYLDRNAIILLDDCQRNDEKRIAELWVAQNPLLKVVGQIAPRTLMLQLNGT